MQIHGSIGTGDNLSGRLQDKPGMSGTLSSDSSLSGKLSLNGKLNGHLQDKSSMKGRLSSNTSIGGAISRVPRSYEDLTQLPKINDVTVIGNKPLPDYSLRPIYYKPAEEWNSQSDLISEEGAIYIYTYGTGDDTKFKVKIGDGDAYLIDMPFVVDETVSSIEKEFWNNKVSAYISPENAEELVLSKDSYMLNGEIIYA